MTGWGGRTTDWGNNVGTSPRFLSSPEHLFSPRLKLLDCSLIIVTLASGRHVTGYGSWVSLGVKIKPSISLSVSLSLQLFREI